MIYTTIVDDKNIKNEKEYLSRMQESLYKKYNNKSIYDLMNDIYTQNLGVYVENKELITIDDATGYVNIIYNSLENLLYVSKHPKSFIRTNEIKEYVYKAKRISSKAMFYLGRDSSDWESRKPLNVIPKKILADVSEETLDIYENRVFCDLIHLISKKILQSEMSFNEAKKQEDDFKISKSFKRKAYINEQEHGDVEDKSAEIIGYQEKIKTIKKTIKEIKKTNLYKHVSQVWKKMYSIHKTNNFIFDKNYKKIYEIWQKLHETQDRKQDLNISEVKVSLTQEQCNKYYFNYIVLSILTILNPKNDPRIKWNKDSLQTKINIANEDFVINIDGKLLFSINNKNLSLSIGTSNKKYNYIKLECEKVVEEAKDIREKGRKIAVQKQTKTEEFYIYAVYDCMDDLVKNPEVYTTNLLNLHDHIYKDDKKHVFYALPITARDDKLEFQDEKIVKRLFGIGGMYDPEDKEADSWRFFKRGILQITPRNYKDSFDSLARLVNVCVLFNDTITDYVSNINGKHHVKCPICGEENIVYGNHDDGYQCKACKYIFNNNSLVEKGHKKSFLWVKPDYNDIEKVYKNIKYVQSITEDEEYIISFSFLRKLYLCERISAYATTSSFDFEESKNEHSIYEAKIKTICPKCGKTLHND